MLSERRRQALPLDFLTRVGAAWAVICVLLIVVNWGAISEARFPDPDDTMRLLQVRDLIAGQGWFDPSQYRVDAPGGGVPMHWSRIVDVPLVLVILALTPFLGSAGAESAALIVVPLITLAVAMALAARIAWRLLGDEETTFTALIMALCVPVIFQLAPMRVDHHGWQLVCALAAVNGLMARSHTTGGYVVGTSLATWLMISVEGLPLAAAIYAVLALRWLRDPKQKTLLVSAIQSLALASAALFAFTRGFGDLAAYCDAISPVHIAMFLWGAAALTALARLEPLPITMRLAGFAVAGGGALVMLLVTAPQCATGGGFSQLDPLVQEHWYLRVNEGMPVWQQKPIVILQYAVTPMIGLYATIRLAASSPDWLQDFWRDYALILGASFAVALFVARAGSTACILAAPPLAWQLNRWLRSIRIMESPMARCAGMIGVALALLPSMPLSMAALFSPTQASAQSAMEAQAKASEAAPTLVSTSLKLSNCRIEQSANILNAFEPAEIFAPLDIAPKLIFLTHHSVPATGHHRGNETMRLVIETSLSSTAQAKETLQARGSAFFALCPDLIEPRNYQGYAPDGFVADLLNGNVPDWLEPIETAEGTSFKLWRIKPE